MHFDSDFSRALKATVDYAKGLWTALGPLVGVLIGAWLARSWDKQKWVKDNRKQECRELLTAVSHAATLMVERGMISKGPDSDRGNAYLESLKVFQSRIFIAKDIEEHKLFELWKQLIHDFNTSHDYHKFDDWMEKIRTKIVEIAMT